MNRREKIILAGLITMGLVCWLASSCAQTVKVGLPSFAGFVGSVVTIAVRIRNHLRLLAAAKAAILGELKQNEDGWRQAAFREKELIGQRADLMKISTGLTAALAATVTDHASVMSPQLRDQIQEQLTAAMEVLAKYKT